MPSRTSCVRLSPRPSRSSTSTTRSECSLCRKPAIEALAQRTVERGLAGMPEGRVAEVVAESDGLGEILVEAQRAGDGT